MIDIYDHDNGDGFSTADRITYYLPQKIEAEENACGALLKWFYDRNPHTHTTIKKVARDLLDLTESQNNP